MIFFLSKLLVMVCVTLIRFYQLIISPMKLFILGYKSSCRFYPTCSSYAKDSFYALGLSKELI